MYPLGKAMYVGVPQRMLVGYNVAPVKLANYTLVTKQLYGLTTCHKTKMLSSVEILCMSMSTRQNFVALLTTCYKKVNIQ